MTAQQLAAEMGISSVGVRQHLAVLARDGIVQHEAVLTPGKGRPKVVFSLAEGADMFFPKSYHELMLELLDGLRQSYGDEALEDIFARRLGDQTKAYAERMQGMTFAEKVEELARIRDESGYVAEATTADGETIALREHHCPIFEVAKKYPQACRYELELFRKVLGRDVKVERREHLPQGGTMCSYHIARLSRKKS